MGWKCVLKEIIPPETELDGAYIVEGWDLTKIKCKP